MFSPVGMAPTGEVLHASWMTWRSDLQTGHLKAQHLEVRMHQKAQQELPSLLSHLSFVLEQEVRALESDVGTRLGPAPRPRGLWKEPELTESGTHSSKAGGIQPPPAE